MIKMLPLLFLPGYSYSHRTNSGETSFWHVPPFPWHKTVNYTYINNCFENIFAARLQLQLRELLLCKLFLGKRNDTPPCSSPELFFAEKMRSTEERFRWWICFPGFCRVFVSTTGLESFSLRPEKFSKRFSFSAGCVRFFLLCRHVII